MINPAFPPMPASAAAGRETEPYPERFSFSGTGSEYFRIWIVNLLLTILTLGIYSAWAKVRKLRYFYGSTSVAGSRFDYHGNPGAILKGRLIAAGLLIVYNLTFKFSPAAGGIVMIALALLLPWLLWKSLQFRLFNSSYRGIRFGFRGDAVQAYKTYLLFPVLAGLSAYLLAPLAHWQLKKFQHEEARFGATRFSFNASPGAFYKAYLSGFLIAILGAFLIFGGVTLIILYAFGKAKGMAGTPNSILFAVVLIVGGIVWLAAIFPIFLTMIQNLIWNHTGLGEHRFTSDMKWSRMSFIVVTNLIGIVLTLGLFTPFAQIRALKYRVESMTLHAQDDLDSFIAATQEEASATGEGMADLLDFDLSL